jgi:hypothetical protein
MALSRLVGCVVVAGLVACGETEDLTSGGVASDTVSSVESVGSHDTLDEQLAEELAAQYIACVNEAGLAIEHVSVHDLPRVGIMVKTEIAVPAPIHGPCLELIGGTSESLSSWTTPGSHAWEQ